VLCALVFAATSAETAGAVVLEGEGASPLAAEILALAVLVVFAIRK
jgi:hypothetical protein